MINKNELNFDFDSNGYEPLSFAKVLYSTLSSIQDESESIALINTQGHGFLFEAKISTLRIIEKTGCYILKTDNIDDLFCVLSDQGSVKTIKLKHCIIRNKAKNSLSKFNLIIKIILEKILMVLKYYIWHVYQHLSSRKYGDSVIVEFDVVQKKFAEIHLYLYKSEMLLNANQIKSSDDQFFYDIKTILSSLIILSGARSILKNGIVNFTHDYELFRKIITQSASGVL